MAFVSPRMNLKVWNAPQDPYDHEQLADNWLKVDRHDHSEGRGAQIGGAGIQSGAIATTHLAPASIVGGSIAPSTITTANLADGQVTFAKTTGFPDPNLLANVIRLLRTVAGNVIGSAAGPASYD